MTRKEIAGLVLGTVLMTAPMAMANEASVKCGAGKCGGNKDTKTKTADAKCGANKEKIADPKEKSMDAKCGANKEKMPEAKCGSNK